MRDTRDLRDPEKLGRRILSEREKIKPRRARLSKVIDRLPLASVADYDGGGVMSSDPAKHHSRTPQTQLVESDGGE